MTGTVKMFNKTKGFGFITAEDGKDVFFHYSELQVEGFKTVEKDAKVQFDVLDSDRGPRAAKIQILG
jgi:cold shock protein